MLGLANVLLATVGTVEAVYDASALAVEGGVYGVHGMVVMRSDMRKLGGVGLLLRRRCLRREVNVGLNRWGWDEVGEEEEGLGSFGGKGW